MINQTFFHDETEVFRIAVLPGGITHPIFGLIPEKGVLPLPVSKTGTFSTNNSDSSSGKTVIGSGTAFTTDQISPGMFLFDSGSKVARRIKSVDSDTKITLTSAFPSSVSAKVVQIVGTAEPAGGMPGKPAMITAKSVGTVAATLQEQSFAIGETFIGGGSPISYDVSATNTGINFSIHV